MVFDLIIIGLAVGALYGLLALSVSLIYASLDIVHFAQGELFTMGAFFGWVFFTNGIPFIPSFVLAILCTSIIAVIMQRVIYKPILKMTAGFSVRGLTFIVAGFGMSIILQNIYWLIFGAVSKNYGADFGDMINLGNMSMKPIYFIVLGVATVLMLGIHLMFKRSKIGLSMKAISFNKQIASLMGIDVDKVTSFAFGLAAAMSAIAGILSAQIIFVRYNMAAVMLLKAFSAAVIGGLGNVYGAMLGGLLIGVIETVGGSVLGTQYKDIISFAMMIMVLMFKPNGIFSFRTRQKA
ncbi:MAG: branched-chain amino acid ABC transporter permease [Anaerolineales bacterium]|nr:MAG: branched-chain amino acid ABC transporter permease [Anaerolineales bacterium]